MRYVFILLLAALCMSHNDLQARVVSHPKGCPRKLFCGCGAAVQVFGVPRRDLWRASAWFRFPKSNPSPGKVAVRQHHVFVILRTLENGKVLAYDANSGGGKTQIIVRSLKGYSVRDPGGHTRLAMWFN